MTATQLHPPPPYLPYLPYLHEYIQTVEEKSDDVKSYMAFDFGSEPTEVEKMKHHKSEPKNSAKIL